jgi:hypothetical protein
MIRNVFLALFVVAMATSSAMSIELRKPAAPAANNLSKASLAGSASIKAAADLAAR